MKGFAKLLAIALVLIVVPTMATDMTCFGACHGQCGKTPCACARPCESCPACCAPSKPCVQYEEKEVTAYKTVFEEVVDKVPVEAVKYVEETAYRCVPATVMQPPPAPACAPAKACAPCNTCGPATCAELVPVQVLKKVPYTVFREVRYQKIEEHPRVVVKQVPYTFIQCVPKTVCEACGPAAACGKPACDGSK
jgi:hypothetical protein